ncbi:MAG: hypothetical protein HXY30_00745 [Pseudorhodoplanes sp.]|nr:hypothetical protein [Pseudorhodoplanes sp.]
MRRIALGAFAAFWALPALAQTCDTLGGSAPGCGTNRKGAPAVQGSAPLRNLPGARNDIQFVPDRSGLIGRTSEDDDRPKASIGGLTTDSDGRQCLQLGLSITCTKRP